MGVRPLSPGDPRLGLHDLLLVVPRLLKVPDPCLGPGTVS